MFIMKSCLLLFSICAVTWSLPTKQGTDESLQPAETYYAGYNYNPYPYYAHNGYNTGYYNGYNRYYNPYNRWNGYAGWNGLRDWNSWNRNNGWGYSGYNTLNRWY